LPAAKRRLNALQFDATGLHGLGVKRWWQSEIATSKESLMTWAREQL